MADLVLFSQKSDLQVARLAGPEAAAEKLRPVAAKVIRLRMLAVKNLFQESQREEVKKLIEWLEEADRKGLLKQIHTEALPLLKPASRSDIEQELARLHKAVPKGARNIDEEYAKLLIYDVWTLAPPALALSIACMALRRKCDFTPAISEVLAAVTQAMKSVPEQSDIEKIPELIAWAKQNIAETEAQIERDEVEWRKRAVEQCVSDLVSDADERRLATYPKHILEAARGQVAAMPQCSTDAV